MILVTGGAGYIGSVTVEMLRARGEGVVILDNLSRGHRSAISPDVPFYEGDIGDRELIARIANENQIEACIHFAALEVTKGTEIVMPVRTTFYHAKEFGIKDPAGHYLIFAQQGAAPGE